MTDLSGLPILTSAVLEDAMAALWNRPPCATHIIVSPRMAWQIPRWLRWYGRALALVNDSVPKWLPRFIQRRLRWRAEQKAMRPFGAWCNRWYERRSR